MDEADRGYYYCTARGADAVTQVTSAPTLVDFMRKLARLVFVVVVLPYPQ